MFRYLYFAMEEQALQDFSDFKVMVAETSLKLSSDKIAEIKASLEDYKLNGKTIFTVDNETGVANINVTGPLMPKPDPCAMMFDLEMTTYKDIINASKEAEKSVNVTSIDYHFDTPGGSVVGLFATADVMRAITKPTRAVVHGQCCSAGYALAVNCDSIVALNDSCAIGSIGVIVEPVDKSKQEAMLGIKRHVITSENADNKRHDITTEEGRDKIKAYITKHETVFYNYVASGRNTTTDDIKTNYGQGGVLLAAEALKVGMIDSIITSISTETDNTSSESVNTQNQNKENDSMEMSKEDLEKFGQGIATATANTVRAEMSAEFDKRDAKAAAEATRKAGFTPLFDKFPNQKAMINEEMAKEGATASSEFFVKLMDTETARAAAEAEQEASAVDNPDTTPTPEAEANGENKKVVAEQDIAELAAMSGLDLDKLGGV